jgi:anti-sigma regulatory factor (Ser/Thr protein kinase)
MATLGPVDDLGTEDAALAFAEPDDEAASTARRWARAWWARRGLGGGADDLLLVVSELVENARVHAGGPIRVALRRNGSLVRVEVEDSSREPPTTVVPNPDGPGGRGLLVVEALTTSWGTDANGDGKVVWAELPASPT